MAYATIKVAPSTLFFPLEAVELKSCRYLTQHLTLRKMPNCDRIHNPMA